MAPNESIATESRVTTYKVVDKAMDIPIVNDVVMGLKKIADPITPYVEGTLKIVKDKADSSLSENMRGKVGSTLESFGSAIDDLACNGLDHLTTAVPSLQKITSTELIENSKEAAISHFDTAQEFLASFKVARLGISVLDAYLSMLDKPVSMVSNCASTNLRAVRHHLVALRSAGARRAGEPCNNPLSLEMANILKLDLLLGFFDVQLVKLDHKKVDVDEIAEIFECIDEQEGSIEYFLTLLSQRKEAQKLGQEVEVKRLTELINSLLAK